MGKWGQFLLLLAFVAHKQGCDVVAEMITELLYFQPESVSVMESD